jgi:apolipoprotein D and lipocalin family protein
VGKYPAHPTTHHYFFLNGIYTMHSSRFLRASLLACAMLLGSTAGAADQPAPASVPGPLAAIATLDLPRYLGTWYEIAKFPNRFQRQCVGYTKAQYATRPDGALQVENRCRLADGTTNVAIGEARQVGAANSARLRVRFAPAYLSWIPLVWGDYWVIDLDRDYQLAAVSEPGREYLWILARTPTVTPAAYDALVARLARQGFEVSKLVRTPQS